MLHYKAVAKTPMEKIGDILLGVFGMAAMIFTTAQTIKESSLVCALRNDSDCIHSSWLSRSLHQPQEGAEPLMPGRTGYGFRTEKQGCRLTLLGISYHSNVLPCN